MYVYIYIYAREMPELFALLFEIREGTLIMIMMIERACRLRRRRLNYNRPFERGGDRRLDKCYVNDSELDSSSDSGTRNSPSSYRQPGSNGQSLSRRYCTHSVWLLSCATPTAHRPEALWRFRVSTSNILSGRSWLQHTRTCVWPSINNSIRVCGDDHFESLSWQSKNPRRFPFP